MQTIFIGEYIRQRRKALGLTQEQLCDGICDPTTISRIETGFQTPSRSRLNAILQRLGLPDECYYAVIPKNELEIEALKKEIAACNVQNRIKDGFAKIEQLERIIEPDDNLTRQFILRSMVLLDNAENRYSLSEQLNLLMQAIRLTIPHFETDKINDFIYTFDEAKIINQIACTFSLMNESEKAIQILEQLLAYIKTHYQEVLTGNGLYPMVLYNYARELDLAKRYEESIQICENGKTLCGHYGHYQFLPGFLAIMAECYHFLGKDDKSEEFYTQAYYIYRALNDPDVEYVKREAKEYLNVEFKY